MKAQCSPALKHYALVPNRAFVVKLVNWKGNSESDSTETSFENLKFVNTECELHFPVVHNVVALIDDGNDGGGVGASW